jgi:hypothetical protein
MQVTTYIPEPIGRQFGRNDLEGGSLYAILERFGISAAPESNGIESKSAGRVCRDGFIDVFDRIELELLWIQAPHVSSSLDGEFGFQFHPDRLH